MATMFNSSPKMVRLVGEIGIKIAEIMPKIDKANVAIPPTIAAAVKKQILLHRQIVNRYEHGCFQHESKEVGQLGELMQFLVNMHCELQNIARRAKGQPSESPQQVWLNEAELVVSTKTYG